MTSQIDLWETAMHEAGHAVALHRLFEGAARYVTIEPDLDRSFLGKVDHGFDPRDFAAAADGAELDRLQMNAAIYSCAGYGALMACGFPEERAVLGCGSDFDEAGAYLDEAKAEAVALLSVPQNLEAVRIISKTLMTYPNLEGDDIAILMDVADGEATYADYLEFRATRDEIA